MKRKMSIILICLFSMCLFVGCGTSTNNKTSDLTGTWKQIENQDSYQEAVILGDVIEINWISDGGKTKSLYWAGTYVAPTEEVSEYSWDSENDHDKTGSALMASNDDIKTITYKDGKISYSASALGTTTTIELVLQK